MINGMEFIPLPNVTYSRDYYGIFARVSKGELPDFETHRELCLTDLWYLVFFVAKIPVANHPFWVRVCKEVQDGPRSHTVDMWAREHGKSSIITVAETIQRILNNAEERIVILSYARQAALTFLRQIKQIFEGSDYLKHFFPDVLYDKPEKDAFKWSEETGLCVRRKGFTKEMTLEAYGLIEGMPVGRHFTGRVYDDIVTQDLVNTPELMQKVKDTFDMSLNLGTVDGWSRIVGTYYHHEDALMYITNKKDSSGEPVYFLRKYPATVDGSPNGEPVFLPKARLEELRAGNKQQFYSQQLLDPTPQGTQSLDPSLLVIMPADKVPKNLYKFMMIDPAGMTGRRDGRPGDWWAILVLGVEPFRDDLGASNMYLLDAAAGEMTQTEAERAIVELYMRNGRLLCVGVEKVGQSSAEIHVANALRAKGKLISIESGTLRIVMPGGRRKEGRIEAALSWPLMNKKLIISSAVESRIVSRIVQEMQKFPFWHEDIIDAWAYGYDIVKEWKFGAVPKPVEDVRDVWKRSRERERGLGRSTGWMSV